jgi:polyhydroxybutyrate depolymerase
MFIFKSVDDTVEAWMEADGCPKEPKAEDEPDRPDDETTAKRKTYGPGKDGAKVILFVIEGGGHTLPGKEPPVASSADRHVTFPPTT